MVDCHILGISFSNADCFPGLHEIKTHPLPEHSSVNVVSLSGRFETTILQDLVILHPDHFEYYAC